MSLLDLQKLFGLKDVNGFGTPGERAPRDPKLVAKRKRERQNRRRGRKQQR